MTCGFGHPKVQPRIGVRRVVGGAKLDEFEQHPEALDIGTDSFDDADDDAYDPTEFIDEDDEF